MNLPFATTLRREIETLAQERRDLSDLAQRVLTESKRSMFAWHRDDADAARLSLRAATELVEEGIARERAVPRLQAEGSWRSAKEEYVEAWLFAEYMERQTFQRLPPIEEAEIVLGALSDVAGELARKAVLLGAKRAHEDVRRMLEAVQDIVELLLALDLTGSLRSKTDQARQHLRKIEEIYYDLSLRAS